MAEKQTTIFRQLIVNVVLPAILALLVVEPSLRLGCYLGLKRMLFVPLTRGRVDDPAWSTWRLQPRPPYVVPSPFLLPNTRYTLHTNLQGGRRAFVLTGQYERVLPMDIYPMQLLKAILIEDIDLMENLGIYEVAEEDLALCEYVCTSKTEVQSILRSGFELMLKELG